MGTNEQLPDDAKPSRRGYWLALLGGIVTKFGASTVLIALVLFLDNSASVLLDKSPYLGRMGDASASGWFLLQGINFFSAGLAGFVAAWLSPRRSNGAWLTLFGLAVLATLFAQFPHPGSTMIWVIWAAAAPTGVLVGWLIFRRTERAV